MKFFQWLKRGILWKSRWCSFSLILQIWVNLYCNIKPEIWFFFFNFFWLKRDESFYYKKKTRIRIGLRNVLNKLKRRLFSRLTIIGGSTSFANFVKIRQGLPVSDSCEKVGLRPQPWRLGPLFRLRIEGAYLISESTLRLEMTVYYMHCFLSALNVKMHLIMHPCVWSYFCIANFFL